MSARASQGLVLVVAHDEADRERLAALLPPGIAARPLEPRALADGASWVDARAALVLLDGAHGEEAVRELEPLARLPEPDSLLLLLRDAEPLLEEALARLAPRELAPLDAPAALLRHLAARLVRSGGAGRGAVVGQRRAHTLLGVSRLIHEVAEHIERVAPSRIPVLILGETGTGKELVARAVHRRSPRASGPFVAINCGGLPESLLEAELFGAERGAFTGADRARRGLFEEADGGTLFLDEIGDMPGAFQAKLLRVLETREFRRVGGTRLRHADVRIVSATHRDLEGAVKDGEFRQDLYFRINGATLSVPPLRRRRVDIPFLAQHFAELFGDEQARQITLDEGFLESLASREFPGNVRELRNTVERAIAMARPGEPIAARHLQAAGAGAATTEADPVAGEAGGGPLREQVAQLEAGLIRRALERHAGNRTRAARELGLSRLGLRRKMERLGISEAPGRRDR